MPNKAAGLLLYRRRESVEIFLVHPGGPFWEKKDFGAWSLPKGEFEDTEDPLAAAKREFSEETGFAIDGQFRPLMPVRQPSGKVIHIWAVEADCDASKIRSNAFAMEWPPKSGALQEFPEVDRAGWFSLGDARRRIVAGQVDFIEQIASLLRAANSV